MVEGSLAGMLPEPPRGQRGCQSAAQQAEHGRHAMPAHREHPPEEPARHSAQRAERSEPAVGGDERARFRVHHVGPAAAGGHHLRMRCNRCPDETGEQAGQRAAGDEDREHEHGREDRPARASFAGGSDGTAAGPGGVRPGGKGHLAGVRHSPQKATSPGTARRGPAGQIWVLAPAAARSQRRGPPSPGGQAALARLGPAMEGRRTVRDYRRGRQMIEAHDLTKRYGDKLAVDHLSFTVEPGTVTGFLGPNGAGKSTTMRLVLGLDRPDEGTATIDGRRYRDLAEPLRTVGALLEARAMHTGRSAYNHLLFLAQSQGLPRGRVDEVLQLVGLQEVARKRAGGFSLGMSQRLGIAAAMLGDPRVLLLDEPVNGLDPEGVLWIRNLIKQLAAEGRTVFVSSHLMNEMAVTADHLIVIGRGRLIAASSTQEFIERSSEKSVLVRSPDATRLADLINAEGGKATPDGQAPDGQAPGRQAPDQAGQLRVTGMDAPRIGELAA